MNFISHYYCLKEQNPYYTLGALLPDILNNFSFLYNKYFRQYDTRALGVEEQMLWRGIKQHYEDDLYFHNLSFFKSGMQQIEEDMNLNENLVILKRKYLVSHVLYELILDNMILDRQPKIVSKLYDELTAVDKLILSNFLKKIVGENEEITLFLESYDRFLRRRFLSFYSVEINLVKSLHIVSGKISQWEYEDAMVNEFVNIIKRQKNSIDFDLVFDCIKKYRDIS